MTTPNLDRYFQEADRANFRLQQNRNNDKLSPAGKADAEKAIRQSAYALFTEALKGFTREYDSLQTDFDNNAKARGRALDAELSRWNDSAIEAEAKALKNVLRTTPANELPAKFRADKESGIKVRAWQNALADAVYNGQEFINVRNEVKRAYEAARTTPELKKVNERGKALADRAVMLREDTLRFGDMMSTSADIPGFASDLRSLAGRIRIERNYKPELLGFEVNVEMNPAAQEPNAPQIATSSSVFGAR
jgi:hypothetical protein